MTFIIAETKKIVIISLSATLLLFSKNAYEARINLTPLSLLGHSFTAVLCSSIHQLIFKKKYYFLI